MPVDGAPAAAAAASGDGQPTALATQFEQFKSATVQTRSRMRDQYDAVQALNGALEGKNKVMQGELDKIAAHEDRLDILNNYFNE